MKNRVIIGLISATGVFYTIAIFLSLENDIHAKLKLIALGSVTGISAIMMKLLVKENK